MTDAVTAGAPSALATEPLALSPTVKMVVIHALGLAGAIYFAFNFSWALLFVAVMYFFVFHLSTTVGAHRYFTHASFEATPGFAKVLAALHAGTVQGKLLWWCSKHNEHHVNEDKAGLDPHTPKDGFWHSHMFWLMKQSGIGVPEKQYVVPFRDGSTTRRKTISWQGKYYAQWVVTWTLFVPVIVGLIFGDILLSVLFVGFTRLVFQYHATWLVNSVGHKWGEKLSERSSARNVGWKILAFFFGIITVGESHHANHHKRPDYWRLGWKWWQFDPGTTAIRLAHQAGWITKFKHA